MDVITTLTTVVTAYSYYKFSITACDYVDKSYKVYTFCKNTIGYVRLKSIYNKNLTEDKKNEENIIQRSFS